ncbi:MAG: hypothetical protein WD342_18570 [Verrucomicrobiales bacterium]
MPAIFSLTPIIRNLVPIGAVLFLPAAALGWGSGHVDWQRKLQEIMPAAIMERVDPEIAERSIHEWSKYIDSFESFASQADLIGEEGMARLERAGIRRRYDLHGEKARAVNFVLIVESLRAERYDAALFWIACFGHSAADMSAANHDPLLHLATYDWGTMDLTLADGVPLGHALRALDLSHTARHAEGLTAFSAAVERMRVPDDGREAEAAMLNIMSYGQKGAAFCAERGPTILQAAVKRALTDEPATRAALFEPMAELGAWALVRVARDVEAALRLAEASDPLPQLNESLSRKQAKRMEAWVRNRKLEDDAFLVPILRPLRDVSATGTPAAGTPAAGTPATGVPATGVILEPTWRMNEGMFNLLDKTVAVAVCRTLENSGAPYATIDLRALLNDGAPSPERLPCLIVPARSVRNYHGMTSAQLKASLRDYRRAGGKVVWIGGNTPPLAAPVLADAMSQAEGGQWPVPPEQMKGSRIVLPDTGLEWTVTRNPLTPAGWHRPFSSVTIDPTDERITPLLELKSRNRTFTTGAVEHSGDEGPLAWLPVYALHPWLLVAPEFPEDPADLGLDEAGAAILEAALAAVRDRTAPSR